MTAENALATDAGPQAVARQARVISGAATVWLRINADAEVVRDGRRRHSDQILPQLNGFCPSEVASKHADERGDRTAGLYHERLIGGAAIAFAFDPPDPDRSRLAAATAGWVQLRLGQRSVAGESRRAGRAELRALRAQISPHFLFNAMGAIAALIRIDPDRAHALLLDFADYTRYSFGRHGEYTTLAEELRSIEIYLSLERARFAERLRVRVAIPPEVLTVAVPFLVLQPLVENAVRHGIEPLPGGGRVSVRAADTGSEVLIEIEDDGAGADPAMLQDLLEAVEPTESTGSAHVGLRNIDERLRAVYGDAYGLIIETAPGAGTKITLTIPKYRTDVVV